MPAVAEERGDDRPPRPAPDDDGFQEPAPGAPPQGGERAHSGLHEIDGHRHAVEAKASAQLVLDPVGVVAGHEARVVDEDAEARRAGRDLRPVEQPQPAAALGGPRPRFAELAESLVELRRLDAAGVLGEELLHVVEQALQPTSGLRRDGDHRGTLAQAAVQVALRLLQVDLRHVPLGEHHEGRGVRLAGDVGHGEVLLDDALVGSDEHQRHVGALGGRQGAQLRVVLDPLALAPLATQARRVDEHERRPVALEDGVDRVPRRARHLGDDDAFAAEQRVQERRLTDVRAAENGDADRLVAERLLTAPREPRDDLVQQVAGAVPCTAERGRARRARAGRTRAHRHHVRARRSCWRPRVRACAQRRIAASSSSPGVMPALASTTKRTRSASSTATRACAATCGRTARRPPRRRRPCRSRGTRYRPIL